MNGYTDYRIPILLAIPLCFCILWAAKDSGMLPAAPTNKKAPPVQTFEITSDGSPEEEARKSIFNLQQIPVNAAGTDLLQTIPGIGPKLAEKIIAERDGIGPFTSADDLARVHGIGPKRIQQFQEFLRFDD